MVKLDLVTNAWLFNTKRSDTIKHGPHDMTWIAPRESIYVRWLCSITEMTVLCATNPSDNVFPEKVEYSATASLAPSPKPVSV